VLKSRPIPTHDYVAHFDPRLQRHRAWLQAALERLVDHEPEALLEGGPLWRLWSAAPAEAAGGAAAAPTGASDCPYPNPLVGVPYFRQRDSAQRSQRDRTCFSSSSMLLEALKPGTLQGANGDDQYLAVMQRYGDTTDAGAQLQALAQYGITARLVQDADFQLLEQQIAGGIPVPCGTIHRGPVHRDTGSGHWLIVIGHTPTHMLVNVPWGEPDLLSGATLNANGMGLRFSRLNFGRRWMVEPIGGGAFRHALGKGWAVVVVAIIRKQGTQGLLVVILTVCPRVLSIPSA
jgi:hypothetical protein